MQGVPPELAGHPDRLRWNAKYDGSRTASFVPHPLAVRALELPPPAGPVLDLACGPSGAALLAAERGRPVTAVDVSDAALDLLDREARRRGLRDLLTLVQADLGTWRPEPDRFGLVLCTGYWDAAVFAAAVAAVAPGGALGWEAFTAGGGRIRSLPAAWCLEAGEPAALLPAGFAVLDQRDVPAPEPGAKRRLLARRAATLRHAGDP